LDDAAIASNNHKISQGMTNLGEKLTLVSVFDPESVIIPPLVYALYKRLHKKTLHKDITQ